MELHSQMLQRGVSYPLQDGQSYSITSRSYCHFTEMHLPFADSSCLNPDRPQETLSLFHFQPTATLNEREPEVFQYAPLLESSIRIVQLKTEPFLYISLKLGVFALKSSSLLHGFIAHLRQQRDVPAHQSAGKAFSHQSKSRVISIGSKKPDRNIFSEGGTKRKVLKQRLALD